MAAVDAQLVSRSDGLVQLFTPAFDHTPHDPGYIKAYPPGLRENGGQYTHAAMWTVLAFALLGGRRSGRRIILDHQSHQSCEHSRGHSSLQGRALCGLRRCVLAPLSTSAGAAGLGIPVPRGGCTARRWKGYLGIHLRGRTLAINPCIPRAWPRFEITYRHGSSRYRIVVENPRGVSQGVIRASLDGREISAAPCEIALVDDGADHYGLRHAGLIAASARPILSRAQCAEGARHDHSSHRAGRQHAQQAQRQARDARAEVRRATAPTVPSPRPLISSCMVRLRGNPPDDRRTRRRPRRPRRAADRARGAIPAATQRAWLRISIRAASSRSVIGSILVRRQDAFENHPIFLPFPAHGGEKRRFRPNDA